jgi:hypothetical protein
LAEEEEKRLAQMAAKVEKDKLEQEEEKEYEKAKAVAAAKKAGQGKKAKAYDAAEAQKKALLKSMMKMAVADEGEEDGAGIEEIKPVEEESK